MPATATTGNADDGFTPRQLADIQKAINDALAIITDPKTGEKPFQNSSDDTILQQTVGEFAEAEMATELAAALAFAMRDPLTASGAGLSSLVQLNGIIRKPGAATIIPVTLGGDPGVSIAAGSLISDANGNQIYAIDDTVVIPSSGTVDATATCIAKGYNDPAAGTIAVIQTPVSGWNTVVNGASTSVGTAEETDAELRKRQQQSTNATSYRQIEAIRAAILNVPGVTFCRAYQNSTLVADDRGIPGKTIAAVVVGGEDAAVAREMLYRVPLGIGYYGNTSQTFYDSQNMAETVQFSRPVERPVSVVVTLEIINDEGIQIFPSNGVDMIKTAILNFAQNGHTPCEPQGNTGFPPGQDIIRSYLYTPVNSVGGARIVSLQLGIDGGAVADQDLTIAWNEIGVFAAENIEVDFA